MSTVNEKLKEISSQVGTKGKSAGGGKPKTKTELPAEVLKAVQGQLTNPQYILDNTTTPLGAKSRYGVQNLITRSVSVSTDNVNGKPVRKINASPIAYVLYDFEKNTSILVDTKTAAFLQTKDFVIKGNEGDNELLASVSHYKAELKNATVIFTQKEGGQEGERVPTSIRGVGGSLTSEQYVRLSHINGEINPALLAIGKIMVMGESKDGNPHGSLIKVVDVKEFFKKPARTSGGGQGRPRAPKTVNKGNLKGLSGMLGL